MPTETKNAKISIGIIGRFEKIYDEEYIAEGFENLGYSVVRIEQSTDPQLIHRKILLNRPDILLFTKYILPKEVQNAIERGREWGIRTVCWLFDLYWGYHREHRIKENYFKADYVFTTDGGHDREWKEAGINHKCVRQGIRDKECYIADGVQEYAVIFVGSDNPAYPYRQKMLGEIFLQFKGFKWFGRGDTDEVRGEALNKLYAKTKIVIGDSVYSPYYWSNRVVETLGRGGFLIHPEVEGIKEEYPYLVTYQKDNIQDLKNRIMFYLNHEYERQEIIRKNFEHVKKNFTIEKKCQEIIDVLIQPAHNQKE